MGGIRYDRFVKNDVISPVFAEFTHLYKCQLKMNLVLQRSNIDSPISTDNIRHCVNCTNATNRVHVLSVIMVYSKTYIILKSKVTLVYLNTRN